MEKPLAARAALLLLVFSGLSVALIAGFADATPNLEKTLAAQRELANRRPADPLVFNDLGNLLVLVGREAEAETAYRRAIELQPEGTEARFNLAVLMQQDGRLGEALSELQQLIEIVPFDGWSHYQLGMLFAERGDRTKAIEHYARAFAYDPELTFATNNPHIIDNRLFTEALLHSRSYRVTDSARTPRQYSDPERIAGMLLDSEYDSEDEEDQAEAREPAKKASEAEARRGKRAKGEDQRQPRPKAQRPPRSQIQTDDEDEDSEDESRQSVRRTVTPKDASNRPRAGTSAGTVVGQPRASAAPVGGAGSAADRQKALERFRALRSRAPGSASGEETGGESEGTPEAGVASSPPSASGSRPPSAPVTRSQPAPRERYRPGSSSTGRLELELLPGFSGEEGDERYAAASGDSIG